MCAYVRVHVFVHIARANHLNWLCAHGSRPYSKVAVWALQSDFIYLFIFKSILKEGWKLFECEIKTVACLNLNGNDISCSWSLYASLLTSIPHSMFSLHISPPSQTLSPPVYTGGNRPWLVSCLRWSHLGLAGFKLNFLWPRIHTLYITTLTSLFVLQNHGSYNKQTYLF